MKNILKPNNKKRRLTLLRKKYVRLVSYGWTNAEIANHFDVKTGSVSGTLQTIFAITGVSDRKALVDWGRKNGIVKGGNR